MRRWRLSLAVLVGVLAVSVATTTAQGRFWVLVNGAMRYTGNVIVTGTLTAAGATMSGPINFSTDGTTAAPLIGFTNADASKFGFYDVGDNQMGLALNGALVHYFTTGTYRLRSNSAQILLGTSDDVALARDAANTFAQRNGATAQVSRLYNTFTTVLTAGEWWKQDWASTANQFRMGTVSGSSSGTARVATWDYGGPLSASTAAITVPITSGPIVFGGGGTFSGAVSSTVLITTTTSPAVANIGANSCGTDAATIAGTDNTPVVTVGATGGTACRVTFDTTAPTSWNCSWSNGSTHTLAATPYHAAATTTTADVNAATAFVAGDVLTGICLAR